MLSKNEIKYINSLKIKKFRDSSNEFIAEGVKIVNEMLASPFNISSIYATDEWLNKNIFKINEKQINFTLISTEELSKMSALYTPNEVLAVVKIPEFSSDTIDYQNELVIMLDNIQDPGNLGTIIRTADWFGIKNIICSSYCVDVYSPKVIQATMGSISRVNIHYAHLINVLQNLTPDIPVYGSFIDGESIYSKKLTKTGIVLFGNESKGISTQLNSLIKEKISIPSFNYDESNSLKAESLNASIAAGIFCFEFRRQIFS